MRIVIACPVIIGIPFQSLILTDIAILTSTFAGRMFLPIFINQIRAPVKNTVRCVVAEVEEKGLVLITFDKINRFDIEPIGEIFIVTQSILRNIKPADILISKNVRPGVRSVSNSFDFSSYIPVETVVARFYLEFSAVIFLASEMPFTNHAGDIPILFEDFG